MSSILPQIDVLTEVPALHEFYAKSLLRILTDKLLSMDEFEIGIFTQGKKAWSAISFDGDDSEDVQLELRYSDHNFVIVVNENSEENFASTFTYKIFENSPLYNQIPEKLQGMMRDVAFEGEPAIFRNNG
ncbi:MAG: hypothetical protein IT233_12720 [Bacteroidia bacterium]|nr:hypothetical protein [Bacteroidia bacterium]